MWKRNKQEKNTLQCCKHLFDLRTFILFPNNAANANTGDQEKVNIADQDLSTNISSVCKNSLRRQALLLATTSNINRMALFLISSTTAKARIFLRCQIFIYIKLKVRYLYHNIFISDRSLFIKEMSKTIRSMVTRHGHHKRLIWHSVFKDSTFPLKVNIHYRTDE